MPHKDPSFWSPIASWLIEHWPAAYGVLLALAVAFLRITYAGGRGRRRLVESILCGLITLAAVSATTLLGVPYEAAPFIGGVVGLLGVDIIRERATVVFNKKEV